MTIEGSATRPKRGRPPKEDRRETYIEVRLHGTEKDVIVSQAKHAGLTASKYIRRRALGQRVISKTDDHVINELRRLGGLQKKLMSEHPDQRAELNAILREVLAAIRRIDSNGTFGGQ